MSGGPQTAGLGAYGERLARRSAWSSEGMVLVDRNWRCDLGEIDLVLRDGDVLVFCEVKTRSSAAFGHPLEAVTPAKAQRLRRLAVRWLQEHDVRPDGIRIDLVGVLLARARSRRGRARAGSGLMVATTHTVSLQGAVGHVVDVQADLSHGLLGTALVGRPDASISEARDRCRAAVINSGCDWPAPAASPCCSRRPTCPSEGRTSTSRSRSPSSRRPTSESPRRRWSSGRHDRRADAGRPGAVRARGAADDDGGGGPRHHRVYVPEPQVDEAAHGARA